MNRQHYPVLADWALQYFNMIGIGVVVLHRDKLSIGIWPFLARTLNMVGGLKSTTHA
jgi:hypothetical protein